MFHLSAHVSLASMLSPSTPLFAGVETPDKAKAICFTTLMNISTSHVAISDTALLSH